MSLRKYINYLVLRSSGSNIILTGVPRSGTTLACRLLCEFPNVIALNEPLGHQFFPAEKVAKEAIFKHFKQFRRSLYFNGTALAKTREGKIVDNAFTQSSTEVRKHIINRSELLFAKPLSADFTLLMKHCAEFTLILPVLKDIYPVFAFIRNPLAILASWHSVNVPVSRGKVTKAARLNPDFHARLNKLPNDLLTRQLFILSWYFEQYQQLPKQQVIYYEQLIASPSAIIEQIIGKKNKVTLEPLQSRNTNQLYHQRNFTEVADRLLQSEGAYWSFYDRQAVKDLAQQMQANNE